MGDGKKKGSWTATLSSVVLSLLVLGFLVFSFFRWMAPALEVRLSDVRIFCARIAPFVLGVLLIVIGASLRAYKQREFDESLSQRLRSGNLFALPEEEPPEKIDPEAARLRSEEAARARKAAVPRAAFEAGAAPAEEAPDRLADEIALEIQKIATGEAQAAAQPAEDGKAAIKPAEVERFASTLDDNDPIIRAIDLVALDGEDGLPAPPDIEAVDQTDFRTYVQDELESASRLGYDISFVRIFNAGPEAAQEAYDGSAALFVMGDGSVLSVLPFLDLEEARRLSSALEAQGASFVATSRNGRFLDLPTVIRELS